MRFLGKIILFGVIGNSFYKNIPTINFIQDCIIETLVLEFFT